MMYEYALSKGTVLQGGKYPYRIEEVLGQGSYGITYKVSAEVSLGNITNKIYFAVKENFTKKYCSRKADGVTMRFPAEFASDVERDLEDFLTEGKRLNLICKSSKHIVKVNETWRENDTAYYAMEFIDGGSLSDYVISKGRLSEKEALKIIMPILEAVNFVHQNRLLHLDIKPENIMLERQNDGQFTPILIDFGITLHFDQSGTITKTSKDHSIGCSDGYAPIEQYSGINQFAPEVDVYALGAVLYYMLVGRDPMRSIDYNVKKIDANLPAETSSQVRAAILHAMNSLRDERTSTVEILKSEIEGEAVHPTKSTKKIRQKTTIKKAKPSGNISRRVGAMEDIFDKTHEVCIDYEFNEISWSIRFAKNDYHICITRPSLRQSSCSGENTISDFRNFMDQVVRKLRVERIEDEEEFSAYRRTIEFLNYDYDAICQCTIDMPSDEIHNILRNGSEIFSDFEDKVVRKDKFRRFLFLSLGVIVSLGILTYLLWFW